MWNGSPLRTRLASKVYPKHANQMTGIDVVSHIGFHRQRETDRSERRSPRQGRLVKRHGPLDIDMN